MSDSLKHYGLQHARLRCPSLSPRACSNSCPSNHLTFCHPLLLLPSIFPSIRVFSNELALPIRWPKYWSFSFSISPSYEYELISFRIDWFDLLAVQGTLKSLLQHHSSKASIILCSAFFIVQLSHPYVTTGKIIALIRRTFVGKVMSLLFTMLSRLVVSFLGATRVLDLGHSTKCVVTSYCCFICNSLLIHNVEHLFLFAYVYIIGEVTV